jgi:hypothetical protein
METRGDQLAHAIDLLPLTIDDQQPGAEQLPALPSAKIWPDDHLQPPRLILERQERRASRLNKYSNEAEPRSGFGLVFRRHSVFGACL